MSALTRFLSKELKEAFGATDNPKFNPMFKETEEVDFISGEEDFIEDMKGSVDIEGLGLTTDFDPDAGKIERQVTSFYSPVISSIESADIGKAGTKGQNIEAFVKKRAPKVKKSETDFMGSVLEGSRPYTKEEAIQEASDKGFTVSANIRTPKFSQEQRQELLEDADGYFEMTLDYNRNSIDAPVFNKTTHYDFNTLAHTRVSYYDNYDDPFFLIEELQSDAVQTLKKKSEAPISTTTDYVTSLLQSLIFEAKEARVDNIVIPPISKLLEAREGSLVEGSRKAFENTYEKAVNKAIKRLKSELGTDSIKVGQRDLEYKDDIISALEINISGLSEKILDMKPRFNKGGLVQRPSA